MEDITYFLRILVVDINSHSHSKCSIFVLPTTQIQKKKESFLFKTEVYHHIPRYDELEEEAASNKLKVPT